MVFYCLEAFDLLVTCRTYLFEVFIKILKPSKIGNATALHHKHMVKILRFHLNDLYTDSELKLIFSKGKNKILAVCGSIT